MRFTLNLGTLALVIAVGFLALRSESDVVDVSAAKCAVLAAGGITAMVCIDEGKRP